MLNDLINELRAYFYPSLVFAAALAVAAAQIERGGLKETARQIGWKKALFFLYTSFTLFVTVLGRHTVTDPLASLLDNFWPLKKQEWENIFMFTPISFLGLTAYRSKRPVKLAVGLGFGLSLFIELSQLVARLGQFQLSDLLFNTLGALLGGALFVGIRALTACLRQKHAI